VSQTRNTQAGDNRVASAPGRPLTARSVMASALLGMDPPELPVAQLVRLTGLFGISENRARVALSRMVAAGEATTNGSGHYRLAGHLAARQARQSASRAGITSAYDGTWWIAVVTTAGSTAEVRGARRSALA
jgi:phenylacetic acid degradation operon negative regulatory protein